MLKEEQLELLSRVLQFTDQPFRGLDNPTLSVYLDSGPRWSDPAAVLAAFREQAAKLIETVSHENPQWREQIAREVARSEPALAAFLHSPRRELGLLLLAGEWADLLEVYPLSAAPKNIFHYDYYLHLEPWLALQDLKQAEVIHWLHCQNLSNRLQDTLFVERLGYGALDLQRGNWFSDADVLNFVSNQPGPRYYARYLLRVLGKRFPDALATEIWETLNRYGQTRLTSGSKEIPFAELAREWYQLFGVRFEKEWYFGPYHPARHYLFGGHEWEPGLLRGLLARYFPMLELLGRAGINFWQFFSLLRLEPRYSLKGLQGKEDSFWPWAVASLNGYELSAAQMQQATQEILEHTRRLNLFVTQPTRSLALCEASLDYFRRLEIAGLGATAIGC